ncbi:MAG: hypothetical protein NTV01_12805 [Bacteroidia bacterium]|nr:hypothetical protein [Bacteroidia bacterium]
MIGSVRHSPGKIGLQEGYDWTGNGQILFTPSTGNAWMEADFTVENAEYRGLLLKMSHAPDYGNYKLFIDGKPIARVPMTIDFDFADPKLEVRVLDLYSEKLDVYDYYLGSAALKKGMHTIRFEQVGKDANSSGNSLGFDSFRLMTRWNKKRVSLGANSAKQVTGT